MAARGAGTGEPETQTMNLADKAEKLRTHFGMEENLSVSAVVTKAIAELGLVAQVQELSLIQKTDACLAALGNRAIATVPVVMGLAVDESVLTADARVREVEMRAERAEAELRVRNAEMRARAAEEALAQHKREQAEDRARREAEERARRERAQREARENAARAEAVRNQKMERDRAEAAERDLTRGTWHQVDAWRGKHWDWDATLNFSGCCSEHYCLIPCCPGRFCGCWGYGPCYCIYSGPLLGTVRKDARTGMVSLDLETWGAAASSDGTNFDCACYNKATYQRR